MGWVLIEFVIERFIMRISLLLNNKSWIYDYEDYLIQGLSGSGRDIDVIYDFYDLIGGDILFILGYMKVVPNEVLAKFTHSLVVHESDLPKGKGAAPMTWQILNGSNEIVFSLINACEVLDSGDVFIKRTVMLNGTELCDEWRGIQALNTVEICNEFLDGYNGIVSIVQKGKESFYPVRKKENSEIDINKTISEQFNLLRVVDNKRYPAFFIKEGIKYVVSINKFE